MNYSLHTLDSAPSAAKELLAERQQHYGFVPNLLAIMAESPNLLKAYIDVSKLFAETELSNLEQQVILLSVSYVNDCAYCMAAHCTIAKKQHVSHELLYAIREGKPLSDPRLEVLRNFTETVVTTRGRPSEKQIELFLKSGYSKKNLLEVILGVGLKTLSNYTNHIGHTPVDAAFTEAAWLKK